MRSVVRNNNLKTILNSLNPGASVIYSRALSSVRELGEIKYTSIKKFENDEALKDLVVGSLKKISHYPRGISLDLKQKQVLQVNVEDVSTNISDDYGQIVVINQDDLLVRYGSRGVSASEITSPDDLLKKSLIIPKGSFGVLDIPKHVPFKLDVEEDSRSVAFAPSSVCLFPSYKDNISKYSLTRVIEYPRETGRIIAARLQTAIFEDKRNEYFYEEITSRAYPPSKYNRSSGTLMNFEIEDVSSGIGKTTDSHYHPSERSLYIFTTHKPAGVTLNFCGIEESPEDRKDCEVNLTFPQNSLLVLNFASYTHHKFRGEFVCMSIHPREGDNLIKAVESGTIPNGFLEYATVFSKTSELENKWDISIPNHGSQINKGGRS